MAEYQYRTSSVMERPPSNFEHPLQLTKQIRRVQWETTRLPETRTSTTAANQAVSEKIALYFFLSSKIDYESLMVEHTLSFADYE